MAKRKEEKEEVFYVGLSNSREMRRDILESMKESIIILRTSDRMKSKRAEKVEKILELKKVISDIDSLIGRIKRRLPKARSRLAVAELPSKPVKETPKKSDIEKLEEDLAAIEDKLGRL